MPKPYPTGPPPPPPTPCALLHNGVEYYTAEQVGSAFTAGWWAGNKDRHFDAPARIPSAVEL